MLIYFDPCNQILIGHIILVDGVWLFNFHPPFFTMTIMLDLLNWLFTSKGGEIAFTTLLSFQLTAVMFEDTSITTSDDLCFSLFIFTILTKEHFPFDLL